MVQPRTERDTGRGPYRAMPRPRPHGVAAWAWTALFAGVALWEIFLRLDGRVLTPRGMLCLFPLLLLACVCVGGALVRLVGAGCGALLGRERARALARPAFAL